MAQMVKKKKKKSVCKAEDQSLTPELGRFPEEGNIYPFQYSCLRNPRDRGDWQTTVHAGHKEPDTTEWLTHTMHIPIHRYRCRFIDGVLQVVLVGKELVCQYRRQKRCRFNPWVGKIPWRRAWQPTPVFLPGESRGQRNLVGHSP